METVYWIHDSTLDENSNDLMVSKDSVLDEEEQEEINLGHIVDLAGGNNENAEDIGEGGKANDKEHSDNDNDNNDDSWHQVLNTIIGGESSC